MNRLTVCLIVVLGVVLVAGAQTTRTWQNVVTTNWSDGANWSGGVAPGPNDIANLQGVGAWYNTNIWLDSDQTVTQVLQSSAVRFYVWNYGTRLTTYTFNYQPQYWAERTWAPAITVNGPAWFTNAYPGQASPVYFNNVSNQFLGGIDCWYNSVFFRSNYNVFAGTIRVEGGPHSPLLTYDPGNYWETGMFGLWRTSSNNTFNTGQFILNQGGCIYISISHNLLNITNVAFRGGTLKLGGSTVAPTNTFSVFPGGFNVARGCLWISGDNALGSSGNTITLGSPGFYGFLRGRADTDTAGMRIDRAITLAGNGGWIHTLFANWSDAYETGNWNANMWIGSTIAGSGELVLASKPGYYIYIGSGSGGFTPNLYSGGTRIVNGFVDVRTNRSLGTGNVRVELGRLYLNSSNNVAPGASVYVGGIGRGNFAFPAGWLCTANGVNYLPPIDTNSVGMLYQVGTSLSEYNARLSQPYGYCWLGGGAWINNSAVNIAPCPDGVYRLAGGNNAWLSFVGPNAFTGTNRLICGIPYNLYNYNSGISISLTNSFTGDIIANQVDYLPATYYSISLNVPVRSGGSPLGNTNANLYSYGAVLGVENGGWTHYTVARPVKKDKLLAQGHTVISVYNRHNDTNYPAWFDLNEIVRSNRATFLIDDWRNWLGDPAYAHSERFRILQSPPGTTNGMVAPWMVGSLGTATSGYLGYNCFLDYNASDGFKNAPFTYTGGGAGFVPTLNDGTEIVNVTNAATLGADVDCYAMRITNAVSKSGANDTVTIRSGGLIINGSAHTSDVDWQFTNSGGLAEAVIYCEQSSTAIGNAPTLSGRIWANGLTKCGPCPLNLTGDNRGTLFGSIVLNQGYLRFTTTNNFGNASGIILNGGGLATAGSSIYVTNPPIQLGPVGGLLNDEAWLGLNTYGPITDLVPGDAGPLKYVGGYHYPRGNNTYSGGTWVNCGFVRLDSPHFPTPFGSGPVLITTAMYLFNTNTISIPGRVSLDLSGVLRVCIYPVRIGSLDGYGRIYLGEPYIGAVDVTLLVGSDNTDSDYFGQIADDIAAWGRPGHLVKEGTGRLTLWNEISLTRGVTVSNGTLEINGELHRWARSSFTGNPVSQARVKPGATLSGKGSINIPVVVEAGGKLGGSLVLTATNALNSASSYELTINGTNAVSQFGQIRLRYGGTLALNNVPLSLTLGAAPPVGSTYKILDSQEGSFTGQFAQGNLVSATYGGKTYFFRVTYASDGITLTALPAGTMIYVR